MAPSRPMTAVETRPAVEHPQTWPLGESERHFRAFYDEALPEVYTYLFHRCARDHALTQDLVQEVFTAVVPVWRTARSTVTVPFVIGIARHKLVDHFRRQEREQRRVTRLVRELRPGAELDNWYDDARREDLVAALGTLPPLQRLALSLRYFDGLSVPEVASAIGKSTRATESILVRARAGLRQSYEEGRLA